MPARQYLELIKEVYADSGGIEGQRAPLKTKTGIVIRRRMVEDIRKGAILPPIVVGAVVTEQIIEKAHLCINNDQFAKLVMSIERSDLSIIDGMQRTTALQEALNPDHAGLADQFVVRIDLWLAHSIDSLVYRMLVLNTGQVPWDIKRQLETIYKQVLSEIEKEVPGVDVFNIDDKERRSAAGQYRSTRIVELFLAFTSRKPHIELKERVAEDFARMEATEATANERALPTFVKTMSLLARLDKAFASTSMRAEFVQEKTRFKEGRDIFTSAPASIGFSAAAAQFLLGEPGYDFDFLDLDNKISILSQSIDVVEGKIRQSVDKGDDFIDYLTLNEKISLRSGRIGEYEREFFFRAFAHLFRNAGRLNTLTPCWSAYK